MPKQNLSEFNPEFRLLLASALFPLQPPEIKHLLACCNPELGWSNFTDLVKRHRVFPTVYHNLSRYAAASVPEAILGKLQREDQRNRQHILQILATLSQISEWFARQEIKMCVLKGPLLAQRIFDDVGLRTSSDLDLFIPLESLAQADALLLSKGCLREFPASELTPRQWRAYRQEWYNFTYYFPPRHTYIELHWALGPPDLIPQDFSREILSRARPMVLSNRKIYTIAGEDLPVYLLIHGSKHNWVRLKWLLDFTTWMRRDGTRDWESLKSLNDIGLARSMAQGIFLAHSLFSIPVPRQVRPLLPDEKNYKGLVRYSISAILDPNYTGMKDVQLQRVKRTFYTMRLKSGLRYKWAVFTKITISPTDWEDLQLPDVLFPIYRLLRPLLWLWRYHLNPRRKDQETHSPDQP